jgi:hypothetical protein
LVTSLGTEIVDSCLVGSDISVFLVSMPTQQTAGYITVIVPADIIKYCSGFSFQLPEQFRKIAARKTFEDLVKLSDGKPLPPWLQYNGDTNTFIAANVPPGELPVRISITIGQQIWLIDISIQEQS